MIQVAESRARALMVGGGQYGLVTDEMMTVNLTSDERAFVKAALLEWGGPARPTDEMAVALGSSDASSLSADTWGLWKMLEDGDALPAAAWRQVLLAVEVVFASDVVGSGLDWHITTGFSDAESIRILRGLQRSCRDGATPRSSLLPRMTGL